MFGAAVYGQYQMNGSANQVSCNCYQLTPDQQDVGGSVWNVNQIDLNSSFNFNFEVWLDCSNLGADGIAFVLQPVSVTQGSGSSSLGYGGIAPSLVVEVDTWSNDVVMSDPQDDHIAIMMNGSANHASANNLAGPVQASSTLSNIENCAWHTVQVQWDPGFNTLAVFFDGVFRTSYTGDVINDIFGGDSQVYWGWTGGTGGLSADQRFCNSILPDYSVSNTSQCVGDEIVFTDASLTSSGNISNYSWDFGDGNTGTGIPISHVYSAAATYDVTLEITTEGCTEDTIIPITIDPSPVVDLGADVAICEGDVIQLNNPNSLGNGTYSWSPITALSSAAAPSPTSSPATSINYELTFTASNGCSGTDDVQVTVSSPPMAVAGADQTICEGEQLMLQASGGISYSWSPAATLDDANIANPNASPSTTTTYTVTVSDINNCSDSDDVIIDVLPSPTIDAGQNVNVCEGDVVQLNATGTGNFAWSPATGLSGTGIADPTASPSSTITYFVTLTGVNNCSATDSVIVDVDPIPIADFPNPVAVCDGNPVQFNDNSTGSIATYTWDFGDGQVGQGADPTHLYAGIGVYDVTLTTVSANGCSDTATGSAEIIVGPLANFSIPNGPDFCEFEEFTFTNSSTGPIDTYEWEFGDPLSTTSADFAPTFAFQDFGDYSISLTVVAADNCSTTFQQDVSIHPVPDTEFGASISCFGEETQFTEMSSIPQGTVNGWAWDFGDGSNINNSQNPVHNYAAQGSYVVSLVSQSALGCRDTVVHDVFVNVTPDVDISSSVGCLGTPSEFTNSTVPNGSSIVQWDWTFGDGLSDSGFAPNHLYQNYGSYSVGLTAVTDSGCVGSTTMQVDVYPYPVVSFGYSTSNGCTPVLVDFSEQSSVPNGYAIGSYEWIFGDGGTSTDAAPAYIFNQSGIYDVSLVVTTDGGGCADTLTIADAMSIYVTPEADFVYDPESPTMVDPRVRFTNTSQNGTDYTWDFGDGGSSQIANPTNTYAIEGDYEVTLVALNGWCSSSITQIVTIDPVTFVYIPNSFTPDESRLNDGFIAKGIGIEGFEMTIFNRWGSKMYYTTSISAPWNGDYKGKKAPAGTYVYRIDVLDVKGETQKYIGHVNLIR